MHTLQFKVIHRLLLIGMVNEAGKKGGSLSDLKNQLKTIEKLELSEDEKTEIGMKVTPIEGREGMNKTKWDPDKDIDKNIDLSDEQFSLLHDIIVSKNKEKSFNLETFIQTSEIAEKFGIDI